MSPRTLQGWAERLRRGRATDADLERLTREELRSLEREAITFLRADMQANQLVYYRPINGDAERVHRSTAREVAIQGGNKSGKTGTMLAEAAIQMTGIVPDSLKGVYPQGKLRGRPIRVRLVVTSLVSAWDENLKPKLQYFRWNGKLNPDGLEGDPDLGHWGLIPQSWLKLGSWDDSWNERHRVLRLIHPKTREPWSTLSVMSHDQALEDFNQGAFDLIVEDEIPPEDVHRANRIRAMELGGQILVGGTPPDDRTGAVTAAWFHDDVLRPGLEGSNPTETFAVALWTENNPTLSVQDLATVTRGLTDEQRRARLHGEFLHLAGLIFPGLKEKPTTWCFYCQAPVYPVDGACPDCQRQELVEYCHVWDEADMEWPGPRAWPTLFYMDPHQSRPTACGWFKVDPQDGWWMVAELEVAGSAADVKAEVLALEADAHLDVLWRKADPKITVQPNQFVREYEGRPFTIREAFAEVGFDFEEANSNFTVARERILEAYKPNPHTAAPRFRIHRGCGKTLYQMTHFVWQTSRRQPNVNLREDPSKRNSDFPALVRYMANDDPTWRGCQVTLRSEPIVLTGVGRNPRTGW